MDMLEESPQTYQQCRNFKAVGKWHEQLLQNHIEYLRKLRRQLNILNPTFPLAFTLSTWGRGLQSPDKVWAAIMACTTQGTVEYHDPPKRGRDDIPVAQTVLTDVPEYPSLVFKRNDSRSKFQRAMIANTVTLREIFAYSIFIPYVHGMTIHHDTSCHDKRWLNRNILYLMGHKFDSDTDIQINRRIHLQNNIWRNGLFIAHQTSFTDTNHHLRLNPSQYTSPWMYCQDGDSYSDDILTESDEDDSNIHSSWIPVVTPDMTVEDDQREAFKRFMIKNHVALRRIGNLVNTTTKWAETRWNLLIDWTKPEALTATDEIVNKKYPHKKYTRFAAIRHTYISKMTKIFVRRLVRHQLQVLHHQGNTPSDRHPLMRDANGIVHPTSRIFFLLERQLGMTHQQLVKKLVNKVRKYLRQFGKEYSSDSEGDGPGQLPTDRFYNGAVRIPVCANWNGTSGRVVLQCLDPGYSSNSMGDGPMWIPITMALRDAIDACASPVPECDINATTMEATFTQQYPPWQQLATWDGQRTADAVFLFISFGYQCGECTQHFIGDDSHAREHLVACPICAKFSVAARLWLVNANHAMVIRALATMETRSMTPTRPIETPEVRSVTPTRNICRKLELSHLTPVKGSHLQKTNQWVTAESRLLFISKCDKCGELVQPSNRMIPRNCLVCDTPLGFPVEYAINEDIHYDASVLEKFPVSAPTPVELIMAGMGLSAKDRETQANNKYITHFPSWPLTTKDQIKAAVCTAGLQISCGAGYYSMPSMKTQTATFESMEKRIGMSPPTGFGTLANTSKNVKTVAVETFKFGN